MEQEDFPPPPPDMLDEEEEGERFEFDDSCDEAPEADRPPPAPPVPDYGVPDPCGVAPVPVSPPSSLGATGQGNGNNLGSLNSFNAEADLPPPPENCAIPLAPLCPPATLHSDLPAPPEEEQSLNGLVTVAALDSDLPPPPEDIAGPAPQTGNSNPSVARSRVDPYSVIDITPMQQTSQQAPPLSSSPSNQNEGDSQETPSSPVVPSGYSVPVPCGYATPSSVPIITPAYTTPVIIRHFSVDEDVTVVGAGSTLTDSVFSEEYPAIREEDALAKWASDPANTAWMDNPDEVIYDDVPQENSGSTTDPDEMIYDDVELGEEGGSSSLDNGWSSSEFESYEETSDGENGHAENGLPSAFVRGRPPSKKTHVCISLFLTHRARDGTHRDSVCDVGKKQRRLFPARYALEPIDDSVMNRR